MSFTQIKLALREDRQIRENTFRETFQEELQFSTGSLMRASNCYSIILLQKKILYLKIKKIKMVLKKTTFLLQIYPLNFDNLKVKEVKSESFIFMSARAISLGLIMTPILTAVLCHSLWYDTDPISVVIAQLRAQSSLVHQI